ncbi:MAG: hypothetical protein ACR2I1_10970 [Propionibacteriaceae bacterium]
MPIGLLGLSGPYRTDVDDDLPCSAKLTVTVVMSASGLTPLPRLVPSALTEPDHAAEAFAAVFSGQ